MSEKAPQCHQCIFNIDGCYCYRNNDGKALEQLKTPCSSREVFHNCATCNKVKGKDCLRIKVIHTGFCRDWVIKPYFDLALKGGN